ncbi:MAG: DUF2510 domain-containing protein [Candidatus Saccharibacteria bacterium]|nr:DUF2510 domain-containing protein [Microbacteriaceae bacterium]
MNDHSPVPAGWYRDPLGLPQLRWWNGLSWTNRIEEHRPEIQLATPEPIDSRLVGAR